jgi:hypothetical protein
MMEATDARTVAGMRKELAAEMLAMTRPYPGGSKGGHQVAQKTTRSGLPA